MEDGGPAFPRDADAFSRAQAGMSLRDWFAGQALSGSALSDAGQSGGAMARVARAAYAVADAMLAARKGR